MIYQHTSCDLSDHVDECKRKYNDSASSYFMRGSELMVETHCIPEVVYYEWMRILDEKGIPRQEQSKYMYQMVQSPEYAAFRTSKVADKIKRKA